MMNVSEFSDDDNATSFYGQSSCKERYGYRWNDDDTIATTHYIISYASVAVGIPGNILSAIVWLRRRKTSSAVYLAALAINDLVYLLVICILDFIILRHLYDVVCADEYSWLCLGTRVLYVILVRVTIIHMNTYTMNTVGCVWELACYL